jgi:hemerythrin-like metal-binding protein
MERQGGVMKKASAQLGVPAIDREHLAIDALLERAAQSTEAELPLLLDRIAEAGANHFEHEERLTKSERAPVLERHRARHAMILNQVKRMQQAAPLAKPSDLRLLMTMILPQLIGSHMASIDRLAVEFRLGHLTEDDFNALRAPIASS